MGKHNGSVENVSYITTGELPQKPIPLIAIAIIVFSLALFGVSLLVGFASLAIGVVWLYLCNLESDNRKKHILQRVFCKTLFPI